MTNHFNNLTEAEQERLAILIEECSEVAKAGCKILRHGYESDNNGQMPESNRVLLQRELGDVLHIMYRMVEAHDLNFAAILHSGAMKGRSIAKYLHHQEEAARLESERRT
jgi:hypothetical protein